MRPLTRDPFVCGTRTILKDGERGWRVVCATCEGGGTVLYKNRADAITRAIADSPKPCPCRPPCGAR